MNTTKYVTSWFARAEDDLNLVALILEKETTSPNPACFHAQQAAEKYLKGFLAHHEKHVRNVHDLENLLQNCKEVDPLFGELQNDASYLTRFYVESRYPDEYIEFSRDEAQKAYESAGRIKEFVLLKIK